MKLKARDVVATLLVTLIAIPYVGYLVDGEMPLVEDPRGMSAVGLLLGAVAYVVLQTGDPFDRPDKVETAQVEVCRSACVEAPRFNITERPVM